MMLLEAVVVGTFVLATVGFMYRMSRDVSEIKKQVTNDIQHISNEESEKRRRVYERLDENKKEADERYVGKSVCDVLHIQLGRDISEMKGDIKTLLKRNGG